MTKVNRHRTYGTTPELRIIAKSLIAPALEPSLVVNWWTSWCSVRLHRIDNTQQWAFRALTRVYSIGPIFDSSKEADGPRFLGIGDSLQLGNFHAMPSSKVDSNCQLHLTRRSGALHETRIVSYNLSSEGLVHYALTCQPAPGLDRLHEWPDGIVMKGLNRSVLAGVEYRTNP